jgi:hypothetical protein
MPSHQKTNDMRDRSQLSRWRRIFRHKDEPLDSLIARRKQLPILLFRPVTSAGTLTLQIHQRGNISRGGRTQIHGIRFEPEAGH